MTCDQFLVNGILSSSLCVFVSTLFCASLRMSLSRILGLKPACTHIADVMQFHLGKLDETSPLVSFEWLFVYLNGWRCWYSLSTTTTITRGHVGMCSIFSFNHGPNVRMRVGESVWISLDTRVFVVCVVSACTWNWCDS
jgi:hypothetical protein